MPADTEGVLRAVDALLQLPEGAWLHIDFAADHYFVYSEDYPAPGAREPLLRLQIPDDVELIRILLARTVNPRQYKKLARRFERAVRKWPQVADALLKAAIERAQKRTKRQPEPEPLIAFNCGQSKPHEGAMPCTTCHKYVRHGECGTDQRHVEEFAAATCAWPCVFPLGKPPRSSIDDKVCNS